GWPPTGPAPRDSLALAGRPTVEGPDRNRGARHRATLCRPPGSRARRHLVVGHASPPHIGLGSGTQMAMAVAAALRRLHGLDTDATDDALVLGRGRRSGIGIAAFKQGGLIVDAGRRQDESEPPVVARHAFPEEWRVILIMDHTNGAGLHGEDEVAAFRALPPFPVESASEICRR